MGRKLLVLATVLLAVAFAASPVAAAEPGMTVDIGGTHLVGRVVVNVDVTFTCQPKPEDAYPLTYTWGSLGGMESPSIVVSLRQAIGRQQAFGETTKYIDPAVVCTGTAQTMTLAVVPDGNGPGFKAGTAAIDVSAFASYYVTDLDT
ncbi:MAG TPA: hypothetical protein VIR16_04545 [Candidatus Limnocylindrales bacterium]